MQFDKVSFHAYDLSICFDNGSVLGIIWSVTDAQRLQKILSRIRPVKLDCCFLLRILQNDACG